MQLLRSKQGKISTLLPYCESVTDVNRCPCMVGRATRNK